MPSAVTRAPLIEPLESRLLLSTGGELTGPSSIQFGAIAVGDSLNNVQQVTVTNTSLQTVTLDGPYSHDTSEVTVDSTGFPVSMALDPGSSASFNVILNTSANLSVSTIVTAEYNDGQNEFLDIPVTATVGSGSAADTTPPTAKITYAKALRVNAKYYYFAVTYTDDTAVNESTLDSSDILVSRKKYPTLHANFISASPTSDAASITAVYAVRYGKRGTWTSAFDGLWTLSLASNQVTDKTGNAAAATTLGQVAFLIPATAARSAAIARPDLTNLFATTAIAHRNPLASPHGTLQ